MASLALDERNREIAAASRQQQTKITEASRGFDAKYVHSLREEPSAQHRQSAAQPAEDDAAGKHGEQDQQATASTGQPESFGMLRAGPLAKWLQDNSADARRQFDGNPLTPVGAAFASLKRPGNQTEQQEDGALSQKAAMEVGAKNNYNTEPSVAMSFENDSFGKPAAAEEQSSRLGGIDGLSQKAAMEVGAKNNYNTESSVAMSFENDSFGKAGKPAAATDSVEPSSSATAALQSEQHTVGQEGEPQPILVIPLHRSCTLTRCSQPSRTLSQTQSALSPDLGLSQRGKSPERPSQVTLRTACTLCCPVSYYRALSVDRCK